ncbi:MAG TPA: site-specific integrase [Polyangia bacterium]
MNTLPTLLQGFFTDRLICQRQASPHTIAAYRDTMKLLLGFAARSAHKQPADLELADLDAVMIGAFLTHLEADRGNAVTTRNARLAAIHALFRYAALNAPEHAALIERVLAIPAKRCDRAIIGYLTHEQAASVLSAPDRSTWLGRRDHALLLLAIQTGLRVSELIALRVQDVHLGTGPHVRCHGKGRKDRITPLTKTTVAVLRVWLAEHGSQPDQPLFTTGRGQALSRDAVQGLVAKHAATAARTCPSLTGQKVTPHTLRHTAAMALLQAGVDVTVIALWLGHEQVDTTLIYLKADLTLKQAALDRVTPLDTPHGRYHPPDAVLAFLDSL